MATVEERMKVLKLIEDGKINSEEGARLLAALDKSRSRTRRNNRMENEASQGDGRWIRVRVSDTHSGKTHVNMQLPLALVNMGLAVGARFVPDIAEINASEIQDALRAGGRGKVLEVMDEDGELVEIFVE